MFNARVLLYSFRYREQHFGELIFVRSWDQKRKQWREQLQQWSEVKSWLLVLFLRDDCGNFVILFPGLFSRTSGKEILYFVVDGYVAIHGDPSITRVNVKCFSDLQVWTSALPVSAVTELRSEDGNTSVASFWSSLQRKLPLSPYSGVQILSEKLSS